MNAKTTPSFLKDWYLMQRIEVTRFPVDIDALQKRSALEGDTAILVDKPTIFTEGGAPIIIYGKLEPKFVEPLRNAVRRIKYNTSARTGGLVSTSRTFGYLPRIALRRDFCTQCSLANESPQEHQIICEFGRKIGEIYQQEMPEHYARQLSTLQNEVRSDWIIPGTPFTSGIVNWNNEIKYHHDAGNYKDVSSCMLVFHKLMEGGNLSIPEINIRIKLADASFIIFDGQSILHGVTPIKLLNRNGYRYTIVYYALKSMRNCLDPESEVERFRKVRRKREKRRLEDGTLADMGTE